MSGTDDTANATGDDTASGTDDTASGTGNEASRSDDATLIDDWVAFYNRYYSDEIADLALHYPTERRSLHVEYADLFQYDTDLAHDYRHNPAQMREYAEEALRAYDLPIDVDLGDAHVRVRNVGDENTYAIGEYSPSRKHAREPFLGVRGQITKATQVQPDPVELAFECQRCGTLQYVPQTHRTPSEDQPRECRGCERSGPFRVDFDRSTFEDVQKVRIKRPPSDATANQGPTIDAVLRDDLAGSVEPGDLATLVGELTLRPSSDQSESAFTTALDTHSVDVEGTTFEEMDITSEDVERIHRVADGEYGDPFEVFVDCLAPKIDGHRTVKGAIILQTFGGVRVEYDTDDPERGVVHVLLLGDPGTAKSVLLRAAKKLSPRSVYTSGKGATPAGVTATATRGGGFDDAQWTLDAGAFVVASGGRVSFDEIDKTPPEVLSSLHSTLSNGLVSVSKAGINTELEAQTAMLAAGNPARGRFDPYKSIGDQIELGDAMLSRFDLIYLLEDDVGTETDREVTGHMVSHHRQAKAAMADSHGGTADANTPLSLAFVRKYVAYAKQEVTPRIQDDAVADSLKDSFNRLRNLYDGDPDAPVPVTRRTLKGLIRLAEASARVRLSDEITMADVDRAREYVGDCLKQVYRDRDGQFDVDVIETDTPQRDRKAWLKDTIRDLETGQTSGARLEDVLDAAADAGYQRSTVEHDIDQLKQQGKAYEPQQGYLMLM